MGTHNRTRPTRLCRLAWGPLAALAILAGGACEKGDTRGDVRSLKEETVLSAASNLALQWNHVRNFLDSGFVTQTRLTILNKASRPLGNNWKLYFNSVRKPIALYLDASGEAERQALAAQGVTIAWADKAQSGDFYVLQPTSSFAPVSASSARTIDIKLENWILLKSDLPAGFAISLDNQSPTIAAWVPSSNFVDPTDPAQMAAWLGDVRPVQTSELRYAENPWLTDLQLQDTILPRPFRVAAEDGHRSFTIRGAKIQYSAGLEGEARYLKSALHDVLRGHISLVPDGGESGAHVIELKVDSTLDIDGDGVADAEGYSLSVNSSGISIVGSDAAGVLYGIQTLRQLIPVSAYRSAAGEEKVSHISIPNVTIQDAPLFAYRGMQLDVARHFETKETVMKFLDLLAYLKINKFHLRLSDDEGFRLEIPGIPELTQFGARRGFDLAQTEMLHNTMGSANDLAHGDHIIGKAHNRTAANLGVHPVWQGFEQATVNFVGKGSGHYTVEDFKEILRYAQTRHIEVIPEFDFPGHARAAVQSMEYRYRIYAAKGDLAEANRYRLLDPDGSSKHTSVQYYTDNFANPCLKSTYDFLTKVVGETKKIYESAGVDLVMIHLGGDEFPGHGDPVHPPLGNIWWAGSPICQQNAHKLNGLPQPGNLQDPAEVIAFDKQLADYFFSNWFQIATATGAQATGWVDVELNGTGTLDLPGFVAMPWSNVWGWGAESQAYDFANAGRKVVLAHATNLYMDLAYNKDPDEPGYYWAEFVDEKRTFTYQPYDIYQNADEDRWGAPITPSASWTRLAPAGKPNILGLEAQLFGENGKAAEVREYQAFPKLLGAAERAWNRNTPPDQASMSAAWSTFCNTLGQSVMPRLSFYKPVGLEHAGVNYRIPLPGAQIAEGKLTANIRNPGLTIEYSTNGLDWNTYSEPVDVSGGVLLRTQAPDGRTSRLASVNVPRWTTGTSYMKGSLVQYGGVFYRCIQVNIALADRQPPNTPALWMQIQ